MSLLCLLCTEWFTFFYSCTKWGRWEKGPSNLSSLVLQRIFVMMQSWQLECKCRKGSSYVAVVVVGMVSVTEELKF